MRRLLGAPARGETATSSRRSRPARSSTRSSSRARGAGLAVELDVDGEPRPLPPGVDLSAYRIVQEALTNALKHAGARAAPRAPSATAPTRSSSRSSTTARGRRPDAGDGGGHGLVGMRERVALYGGELDAGPRPDGGFAVARAAAAAGERR